MSEWGRVIFFYDYIKQDKRGDNRVRGLISRAYKYPGVFGMIQHAYNGLHYFWERRDYERIQFDLSTGNSANELGVAFDVFFDEGEIDPGMDDVAAVLQKKEISDAEAAQLLFPCEGTDGFLYITYTGSAPGDGSLRYGYYHQEGLVDLRKAAEKEALRVSGYYNYVDDLPLTLHRALLFFEEHGTAITSDQEFWNIEGTALAYMKELYMAGLL